MIEPSANTRGRPHAITLLPKEALVKTSPIDHAIHNYQPGLGFVQKARFQLIVKLMCSPIKVPRLLEVGSGSGVFLPELAKHCEELYGVDKHLHQAAVANQLRRYKVAATLITASAEALPLADHSINRVIAVSTLEFADSIDKACQEIKRVLKESGDFLLVLPGHSRLVDLGYFALTGIPGWRYYEDRRQRVVSTLTRYFNICRYLAFPPYAPGWMRMYSAMRFEPHSTPREP